MKYRGFTLIELMIVIAIISILASIIIPNISKARGRAQLTACMENMKVIMSAMMMADADGVWEIGTHYGRDVTSNSEFLPHPDYISVVPTCPSSGTHYAFFFQRHPDSHRMHVDHWDNCDTHDEIIRGMGVEPCGGLCLKNCCFDDGRSNVVMEWCPFDM
ncbi:MAG: prepilin-type N-terminal cleavage/methylation domain-containing protein [Vulcanimicrobiota bacterium]